MFFYQYFVDLKGNIDIRVKKISKILSIFKRVQSRCPIEVKATLYVAIVGTQLN